MGTRMHLLSHDIMNQHGELTPLAASYSHGDRAFRRSAASTLPVDCSATRNKWHSVLIVSRRRIVLLIVYRARGRRQLVIGATSEASQWQ